MDNVELNTAAVRAAAARLAGRVRRTPLVSLDDSLLPLPKQGVYLKLESMQRSGSFKLRGALNALLTLPAPPLALVTASGGNHGAALACAGREQGVPVHVYLPETTPPDKRARLAALGAHVVLRGHVWDEANDAALAHAAARGWTYVHPFADPAVIAGNGTVALEVLEELPDLSALVIACGGGGLICGCALALGAPRPGLSVIGVEPRGAPTLHASLAAGALVTLPEVKTRATSLAPRRSAALNLKLAQRCVREVVLVSDEELERAVAWLRQELGLAVELSGAAALAAVLSGRCELPEGPTCVVVCGAG